MKVVTGTLKIGAYSGLIFGWFKATKAYAALPPGVQAPGTIGELGEAVAGVNDWRAILIIVTFVMLAQMAGSALQRWQDRKAIDKLAKSIDTLAKEVSDASKEDMLHQARGESALMRVEDLLRRLEPLVQTINFQVVQRLRGGNGGDS